MQLELVVIFCKESPGFFTSEFPSRMATGSPMMLVEGSGVREWPSSKEASAFTSSSNNTAAPNLGLLLERHSFSWNGRDVVPNRSGSAPPSMEGSFAAVRNLVGHQNSNVEESLTSLNSIIEKCGSEEQLRADPAYLEYYWANINLNPRLPPPLISRDKRHLAHHIGCLGDNWKLTSSDDNSSSRSFCLPQTVLSTHKEVPEDERLPRKASNDWAERSTGLPPAHFMASSVGRHKSLVDLIQEDFPRTPSPVYSQLHSASHTAAVEAGNTDDFVNPLYDSSTSGGRVKEATMAALGVRLGTPALGGLSGGSHSGKGESTSLGVPLDDDSSNIESKMKGFSMSDMPNSEGPRSQPELKHPKPSNFLRHQFHPHRGTASQAQSMLSQLTSQGMHHLYSGMDISHGHSKNSTELQPVLQTSGIIPPLYATTTASAYMASGSPFYSNLQTSNLFTPQYSVGGYALNPTLLPPFIAGYPPLSAIPSAFDNSSGPSFSIPSASQSTGGSIATGIDLQQLYRFYGQFGSAPPSIVDPLYMHYFQRPSDNTYSVPGPSDSLAPRMGIVGRHAAFDSQRGPLVAAYTADHVPQFPRGGALSIPSPRNSGVSSASSYGSPAGMGVLMEYPTSPLASPVLPGSPMAGTMLSGRTADGAGFPLALNRKVGAYFGLGQRGTENLNPKSYSFLEELKSSKARRLELSDIAGHIIEFSADQHGSRFIQQKLENCSAVEKASVFEEVLPHASTLMTDVFGNYVIQKFLEHGSPEQRREIANQLAGRILPLSLQMYGCRVVQKALEVIVIDQKIDLVRELDGHVMRCVHDQNGNHVIQKCIECVTTEKIAFIISALHGQVASLSTHPYGCRVIQRVLEHCTDEKQTQCIVDEILQSAAALAQDQYGNYVTQHVLERGKPHERSQIIGKLAGQIVQLSQHKFASNVIEKCLEHGDSSERELLIKEIVGQTEGNDNLLTMMKDQFANYVVQKILEISTDKQREILLDRIRVHLPALKKYTYGKHIVARVEQLFGEEETHPLEA